ncbi:MAG: hypothetical protein AAF681_11760 [Pseudomonadota bacterium]
MQDLDEGHVCSRPGKAANLKIKASNGIHQDVSDAVYVSHAGLDAVYRTIDLNNDGDAMNAGEARP